jgi:two-component system chemotaxis sensor kinase CheA
MDDLLADFLVEANESLAELDLALVRLERAPADLETIGLIFRHIHTLKGTCGFLGLARMEQVAHAAENLLVKLRDGALDAGPDAISTAFTAVDRIRAIVAGLAADGREPEGDDTALIASLQAAAEGKAQAAPVPPPTQSADIPPAGQATSEAAPASQTIRVAVEVLDNLMTLAGELVLTRNQLLQLARKQENSALAVPLQRLSQITSDLQEGVMKTRMQPIGGAWNKLPRLVRDLSRELGKRIELVMQGAETELDRQVLELIRDPLTHMVRNAADHGLESPAERRAAGKPEVGRITLSACHAGGHILIEVADDGRGLPVEKIRAKALARGLASEAELAGMSEAQLLRFIFRPGFSTAASVTAVSGRGVGMDVVKTNIERIGGAIELESCPGQGTRFIVKIPLTLAIAAALIVAAGAERFAIPQTAVQELVRVRTGAGEGDSAEAQARIERLNETPVLRLRERLLPLVNLRQSLQLGEAVEPTESQCVVVVQAGAQMLGIAVDAVFDTEEIVVKPVAPILRQVTVFSGNTILGDGSVVMILDPDGLARAAGVAEGESRAAEAPASSLARAAAESEQRTALLLFRAGGEAPKAVPLGLVSRIEYCAREQVEMSAAGPVMQYRGRLMPLVPFAGTIDPARANLAVLVFTDTDPVQGRDRCMGLIVDEILDVTEERLRVELAGGEAGLLGSAIIGGRATEVIDTAHWLQRAFANWFGAAAQPGSGPCILVVEDSDFFRRLLVTDLTAAGFRVVAAQDGVHALRLRDEGLVVDAIVSDLEMPGLDGFGLIRRLRGGGAWAALPAVALSSRAAPGDVAAAREAGFSDHVAKFDRAALLAALRDALARPRLSTAA